MIFQKLFLEKLSWLKSWRRVDVELSEWQGWDLLLCVGNVTAGNLTQCLNPDSLHRLQPHQQVRYKYLNTGQMLYGLYIMYNT